MSAERDPHALAQHARPNEANAPSGETDGPLILVVDDAVLNRTIMRSILQRSRYRCHLAENGREAVEATRREAYAAVLMDCLMPEMDGYEATSTIRQDERQSQRSGVRRHLPVIAVTAVAIQGARERCIAAGMDDYLSKPIVPENVLAVLDRWLAGAGSDASWTPELAAEPADAPDAPIDVRALDLLRELDPEEGEALVAGVVGDFSTDIAPHFHSMRMATANGDTRAILQELHFIAGCASIVGAFRLEQLARALETGGLLDAVAGAPNAAACIDQLEAEFLRARDMLESLVAGADQAAIQATADNATDR